MLPLISLLGPIVGKVLDKIPDAGKKAELQLELQKVLLEHEDKILASLTQVDAKQAEVNLVEAQSTDKFKSYPRPLAMWVCVFGLVWQVATIVVAQFFTWFGYPVPQIVQLPEFLTGTLMTGLLGLGGYRYLEKKEGITK